jgi:Protein of unknown function (DUF2752)
MELCRRPLAPGETDHELVWLSVSIASLGAAAAWFALRLPWPQCLFHALTGLPCVTCGMTRSAIQFFHGHFLAAWQWNPLVFGFLCALSSFNIYAVTVLATRAPRFRIVNFSRMEKTAARFLTIALLVLNWIYLLSHWRNF